MILLAGFSRQDVTGNRPMGTRLAKNCVCFRNVHPLVDRSLVWFVGLVRWFCSLVLFVRLVRSFGSFVWFVRLVRSFVRSFGSFVWYVRLFVLLVRSFGSFVCPFVCPFIWFVRLVRSFCPFIRAFVCLLVSNIDVYHNYKNI